MTDAIRVCMNDYFDNWTIQLRKGLLEIGILSALKGRERYGYDLVKSLVEVPGLGVTEGPARKYYTLTPGGHRVMETMEAHLDVLLKGVHTLKEEDARPSKS